MSVGFCFYIFLIAAAFALPLIQLIHERLKFLQEETVADKSSSSIAKETVVSVNPQDKDSSFEFSPSEQGFSCKVIESFSLNTYLLTATMTTTRLRQRIQQSLVPLLGSEPGPHMA